MIIYKATLISKETLDLSEEDYRKIVLAIARNIQFVALNNTILNTSSISRLFYEEVYWENVIDKTTVIKEKEEDKKSLQGLKSYFEEIFGKEKNAKLLR